MFPVGKDGRDIPAYQGDKFRVDTDVLRSNA
jgi:hypothetical protein